MVSLIEPEPNFPTFGELIDIVTNLNAEVWEQLDSQLPEDSKPSIILETDGISVAIMFLGRELWVSTASITDVDTAEAIELYLRQTITDIVKGLGNINLT